ncbi:PASTA domain-containing protein [Solwaraspora sp. WMMB335]|uniref:COG1470 family protein n=1 Tax=Solwaraspora sp. WMMB335 TaxID=3404118 RepID=UPI003B95451D
MTTEWLVTTAAERTELDGSGRGTITFTVTNPTDWADRAVFEIAPGDGADLTWFSVEEPQRRVQPAGSVSYLVKVQVPAETEAGEFELRGRVYSADSAPEESSVLSNRLVVQVPQRQPRQRTGWPWWWFAAAGLVVVVALLVTIGIIVLRDSSEEPVVAVPDLSRYVGLDGATQALTEVGLVVGTVAYRYTDSDPPSPVEQSIPAGTEVVTGTTIDLTVTATMTAPTITAPTGDEPAATGSKSTLTWTQQESWVNQWQVDISLQTCADAYLQLVDYPPVSGKDCVFLPLDQRVVGSPSLITNLLITRLTETPTPGGAANIFIYQTGLVRWKVTPLDHFAQPGPSTGYATFTVELS